MLFAAFALISKLQAQPLVNIETVTVGDAGNAADTNGYGAVANVFAIGKYEVTIGQYTSFLNAVAATDPYLLYNPRMTTDLNVAGIAQTGSSGSFSYSVIGSGNHPIPYVNWFDGARFANWMNNGATNGASTETGAYTLNGATNGIHTVNPGATWSLPSEDQWYKAASFTRQAHSLLSRSPIQSSYLSRIFYPRRLATARLPNLPGTLIPVRSYCVSILTRRRSKRGLWWSPSLSCSWQLCFSGCSAAPQRHPWITRTE